MGALLARFVASLIAFRRSWSGGHRRAVRPFALDVVDVPFDSLGAS